MTDHAELIAQLDDVREAYEKAGLHGENGAQIMANAIAALKASEARVADAEAKLEQAAADLEREEAVISIAVAGLSPRRQDEIERGSNPRTPGETIWLSLMRIRRTLADLKGGDA